MFNNLEKNFTLIDANLLKSDINLSDAQIKQKFIDYISYCKAELNSLLKDVRALPQDANKQISLKQFEENFEERILYRIDDITDEKYILQNFLSILESKFEQEVKELNELIDDVEALLMLLPEEIEQNKCVMLAFLK